ncbi:MAG: cytochrome c3 family protein [Syntrophotaleaceae bacterium]
MPKWLPHILLCAYFSGFLLLIAALAWFWPAPHRDGSQPIAFPHTVHAGQLGLACDFCHESVGKSPQAGVPAVSKCLSCHRAIATERPEIQKLLGYQQRGEAIRWQRIHELPDFIYFSHKRHVRSGLDCSACHGGVDQMQEIKRVRSLQMGWCLSCHRSRGASFDCATCHK